MELAYIVALLITYLTFLGSVVAKLEVRLGEPKKWNLIGMRRVKRDFAPQLQLLNDATAESSFVRPEDAKNSMVPQSSSLGVHIRVKRYRHSFSSYPQSSSKSCKLGTCILHNLASQIYQYTDKDKDSTAPARKMSSQGYGRRRRSIPERRLLLPKVGGKLQPWWVSTRSNNNIGADQQENRGHLSQESDTSVAKGKLWTLLRT